MIPVLIPATDKASAHGTAFADPINEFDVPPPDLEEDCAVQVVPPEALQALLSRRSFDRYEKRFGPVLPSERAELLALFSLIELEKTFDESKRQKYFDLTLEKRREQRKEARVRRTSDEEEGMARYLAQHDRRILEKNGLIRTITNELNCIVPLRLWSDKRSDDSLSVGVFARNFTQALHLLLLLNLTNPESIAICGRCRKRFTRTKTSQRFCSLRCGNADRQARLRERKEGKRHGTGKTR